MNIIPNRGFGQPTVIGHDSTGSRLREIEEYLKTIIEGMRELRYQHANIFVINQVIDSVRKIEKALDKIHLTAGERGVIDINIRRLIDNTIDPLSKMLHASHVVVIIRPSADKFSVQINSPGVVTPTMIYITSLCCQILGKAGGSIDFGATLRDGVLDITIEPLPKPDYRSLPPQIWDVRDAMLATGNQLYIHESNDRLYFTVSLPRSPIFLGDKTKWKTILA